MNKQEPNYLEPAEGKEHPPSIENLIDLSLHSMSENQLNILVSWLAYNVLKGIDKAGIDIISTFGHGDEPNNQKAMETWVHQTVHKTWPVHNHVLDRVADLLALAKLKLDSSQCMQNQ